MINNNIITITPNEAKACRKILSHRYGLADPDKIPFSEVVMEKMNQDAIKYFELNDWANYRNNRELCMYYLIKDKNFYDAANYMYEFIYLFHYCKNNILDKKVTISASQKASIEKIIENADVNLVANCNEHIKLSPLYSKLNLNIESISAKYFPQVEHSNEANENESNSKTELKPNKEVSQEIPAKYEQSICMQCHSKMAKSTSSSDNFVGIMAAFLVFFLGFFILIFTFWTIIGAIIGLIMMLLSLGMGGKKTKIWKCRKCGYACQRF